MQEVVKTVEVPVDREVVRIEKDPAETRVIEELSSKLRILELELDSSRNTKVGSCIGGS